METRLPPKKKSLYVPAQIKIAKRLISLEIMQWDKARGVFTSTGQTAEVLPEDAPQTIKPGLWRIALSHDKKRIFSYWPDTVTCAFEFVKIAAPENQVPQPYHVQGTGYKVDGSPFPKDYWAYRVVLSLSGRYTGQDLEGSEISVEIPYVFGPLNPDEPDTPAVLVATPGKGPHTKNSSFLKAVGVFDLSFAWSDNCLPTLEKLIQENGKLGQITIERGFAQSFAPLMEGIKVKSKVAKKPAVKSKK